MTKTVGSSFGGFTICCLYWEVMKSWSSYLPERSMPLGYVVGGCILAWPLPAILCFQRIMVCPAPRSPPPCHDLEKPLNHKVNQYFSLLSCFCQSFGHSDNHTNINYLIYHWSCTLCNMQTFKRWTGQSSQILHWSENFHESGQLLKKSQ